MEEVELAEPREGEVLVRIVGAGVCHSDYHRVDGHSAIKTLPWLLGHEGSGVVERVGPGVRSVAPGDHVIISIAPMCGKCRNCTLGRPNLCEGYPPNQRPGSTPENTRITKGGKPIYHNYATYAERTVVLEDNLVKVRKDVPLEKLCLIGCGVMTGVGAVINRAKVPVGASVAVWGCGGVGLNAIQGAVIAGAYPIIAVDTVARKLEFAQGMGATHFVDASKEDPVARVKEITGGGADFTFDVVGSDKTLLQAFQAIRDGGTCVMVGVPQQGAVLSINPGELFRDKGILGTFYGAGRPRVDFHWLIDLYLAGRLKLDELISKQRPLDEVNEAFEDMVKGVVARTVLRP